MKRFRGRRKETAKAKRNRLYPYKSELEYKVAKALGDDWKYEEEQVPYVIKGKYTPDFTCGNHIMIEVKGFFRAGDQRKYLSIKESNPDRELVFVLSNPDKPVRKGAKLTMSKWCERHGISWYGLDELHLLEDLK